MEICFLVVQNHLRWKLGREACEVCFLGLKIAQKFEGKGNVQSWNKETKKKKRLQAPVKNR